MRLRAKFVDVRPAAEPPPKKKVDVSNVPAPARNLVLAYRIDELIEQGQIPDYTAAARLLGVSQPRLTHLMSLMLLAPEIQAAILVGRIAPRDKQLRRLARIPQWSAQLRELAAMHPTSPGRQHPRPRQRLRDDEHVVGARVGPISADGS